MTVGAGQMPPHDLEAEGAVLSACFIREGAAVDEVADMLEPQHFYSERHRRIFEAMLELRAAHEPGNIVAVASRLRATGRIEQVGGAGYLTEVLNAAPAVTPDALRQYATTVRDRAMLRDVLALCQRAAAEVYAGVAEVEPFVQDVEKQLHAATLSRRLASVHSLRDVLKDSFNRLIALQKPGAMRGTSTGLTDLDETLGGLHDTDLTILAARPGIGKSSLALCISLSVAQQGHGVVFFSLEMPKDQLGNRAIAVDARVNVQGMRTGRYDAGSLSQIVASAGRMGPLPMTIVDTGDLPLPAMRSIVRRVQSELATAGRKLGLVVIDYLQLMSGRSVRDQTRDQQVSEITRGLKALAKEANVPVMALSQLNRALEGRGNKRPQLSDLRESGAIEQDADNVLFLYRDEEYNPQTEDRGIAEVIIAKHRNGPTAVVATAFLKESTRFDNLDPEAFELWRQRREKPEPEARQGRRYGQ